MPHCTVFTEPSAFMLSCNGLCAKCHVPACPLEEQLPYSAGPALSLTFRMCASVSTTLRRLHKDHRMFLMDLLTLEDATQTE